MLERKIVPETAAFGQGFMYIAGTTSVANGTFCKMSGSYARDELHGPVGYGGANNTAVTGFKFEVMTCTDTRFAEPQTWVIKKYEYQRDGSEISLDAIYSGERVVAYNQGWFETDQYQADITASTTIGCDLYVSGGKLTATAAPATAGQGIRAIFWGLKNGYDSSYWSQAPVYFQLLPVAMATGNA